MRLSERVAFFCHFAVVCVLTNHNNFEGAFLYTLKILYRVGINCSDVQGQGFETRL